jgi:hypothetical protein
MSKLCLVLRRRSVTASWLGSSSLVYVFWCVVRVAASATSLSLFRMSLNGCVFRIVYYIETSITRLPTPELGFWATEMREYINTRGSSKVTTR